jgi:hypothetical protein
MRSFFASLALGFLLVVQSAYALDTSSTNYQVFTNTFVPAVMSQTSTNYMLYAAVEPIVGHASSANYQNQSGVPIPLDAEMPTPTPTTSPAPTPSTGPGDLTAQGDRQNVPAPDLVKEKPTLEFTYPSFLAVKKLSGDYPQGADRVIVNGSSDGVVLKDNNRWEKDFPLFLGFNRIVVEAGFGPRVSEPVIADLERLLVGDMNRSWSVDDTDLSLFTRAYGIEPLVSMGDFNDGGQVDLADLRRQFAMWGANLNNIPPTLPGPGPTTVVLQAPKTVRVGDSFQVVAYLEGAVDVDTVRLNGYANEENVKFIAAQVDGVLAARSPDPLPKPVAPNFSLGAYSIKDRLQGRGRVAVFTFEAAKVGTAEIRLTPDSRVLSAGLDLSRVDVLTQVQIVATDIGIPEQPVPGIAYLDAFSTSHPNRDLWYQSRELDLHWKTVGKKVRQVFVGFDPLPNGSARTEIPAEEPFTRFTATSPGLWYGHLKVIFEDGTAKTANIRYQIDDIAPETFEVIALQTLVSSKVPNILRFGSRDAHSGIARYEVFANGILVATTTQPFAPFLARDSGDLSLEVRAFDAAGNVTSAKTNVQFVEPSASAGIPTAQNYIVYVYAVCISLLAFLLFLIFKNLRKIKHI